MKPVRLLNVAIFGMSALAAVKLLAMVLGPAPLPGNPPALTLAEAGGPHHPDGAGRRAGRRG